MLGDDREGKARQGKGGYRILGVLSSIASFGWRGRDPIYHPPLRNLVSRTAWAL